MVSLLGKGRLGPNFPGKKLLLLGIGRNFLLKLEKNLRKGEGIFPGTWGQVQKEGNSPGKLKGSLGSLGGLVNKRKGWLRKVCVWLKALG